MFHIPNQFISSDIATQELIKPSWQSLQGLGLVLQELSGEQVTELMQLRLVYRNLSVIDFASFLLAKLLGAALLTGDSRLYELGRANSVTVHEVIWLLDEMIRLCVLPKEQASVALQKMLDMGARLPQDECRKRLSNWSK